MHVQRNRGEPNQNGSPERCGATQLRTAVSEGTWTVHGRKPCQVYNEAIFGGVRQLPTEQNYWAGDEGGYSTSPITE